MVGKATVALPVSSLSPPVPGAQSRSRGAAAASGAQPLLPVETLLRQQRTLTAVERFARQHDAGELPDGVQNYRALLPAKPPSPGEQYAFDVDLDRCTGCKACVAGCHSLNGLDATETWRSVGMLHGGAPDGGVQVTVTSSCHHCVEPACLEGCPVNAYEKDAKTGIVKHLDDQCFGCQYCTLMCPYDAPKFNPQRKIVRKCDMCADRLAHQEAPACVQACPNGAIAIRVVQLAEVIEHAEAGGFLPGAPAPEQTLPTTTYRTARALPKNLLAADFYVTRPEHAHLPLAFMLVITQWAVGISCWSNWVNLWSDAVSVESLARALSAFLVAGIGLTIGLLHLGRPWLAWRAVLNLRRSWFSREALLFLGYTALVAWVVALESMPFWRPWVSGVLLLDGLSASWMVRAAPVARMLAALTGCLAVYCSVMVYVATQREQWRAANTALRFLGTTGALGASHCLLLWSVLTPTVEALPPVVRALLWAQLAIMVSKLFYEGSVFWHLRDKQQSVQKRIAEVMRRDLRSLMLLRMGTGVVGGCIVPLSWLLWQSLEAGPRSVLAGFGLVLLLVGELCERIAFFRAAPASKMPGALR